MKLIDAKAAAKMLGRKESWVRDRTQDRWPKAQQIPHFRFPGSRIVAFHQEIVAYWHEHGCPAWDGSYPPAAWPVNGNARADRAKFVAEPKNVNAESLPGA